MGFPMLSRVARGWDTRKEGKPTDLWRNHEKRRKTEKNGDILRYEIFQKWPKAAPLLDLSGFATIRESLILPENRLKCPILTLYKMRSHLYNVKCQEDRGTATQVDDSTALWSDRTQQWDLGNQSYDCQNTVACSLIIEYRHPTTCINFCVLLVPTRGNPRWHYGGHKGALLVSLHTYTRRKISWKS